MIKFDPIKHLDRAKKQQILPVMSDATYQTRRQVSVANGAHNTASPPRLDTCGLQLHSGDLSLQLFSPRV